MKLGSVTNRPPPSEEPNVAPLIDIVFILLIFFVVKLFQSSTNWSFNTVSLAFDFNRGRPFLHHVVKFCSKFVIHSSSTNLLPAVGLLVAILAAETTSPIEVSFRKALTLALVILPILAFAIELAALVVLAFATSKAAFAFVFSFALSFSFPALLLLVPSSFSFAKPT